MKNWRTPLVLLGVLLGNSKETRQSLGFLSLSLLFLSLPLLFFGSRRPLWGLSEYWPLMANKEGCLSLKINPNLLPPTCFFFNILHCPNVWTITTGRSIIKASLILLKIILIIIIYHLIEFKGIQFSFTIPIS